MGGAEAKGEDGGGGGGGGISDTSVKNQHNMGDAGEVEGELEMV